MTPERFRELALALPEAIEKSHFGKADFRVRNKIFASLKDDATGVVKFTPDQQAALAAAEPTIFASVAGGWGRQGWTLVHLKAADEPAVESALRMAWRNVAPQRLSR
ncbi:MmcQ/YjbR family DNA-binding protein [Aestuariivirga sp.]|uniref:MmcQ/YjbR family DNA-binding protein n=1 Tax=Aestuariivirga sp. TaxID=2650926 RepID=UPI003593C4C3